MLAHRYWRRTFNASESVVGQNILAAGKPVMIVGVLERGFRGLDLSESLDLPFHTIADVGGSGTNYFAEGSAGISPTAGTMILGRLRPGGSVPEAMARIAALDPPPPPGRTAPQVVLTNVNTAAVPEAARSWELGLWLWELTKKPVA